MYDINLKNVKKGYNFYFIFLFIGILFLLVLSWIFISNYLNYKKMDSKIMSYNIEVNSYYDNEDGLMYSPIYYYTVNGENYVCYSNSSSSINPGTDNKLVYYDSKNPTNCMTEYSKSSNKIILAVMILPLIFIFIAVINMCKINKRVKLIKELNKTGKLVKNLYYHLENTGLSLNNVQIQRPVVDYILPTGEMVTLYGDPRHDKKYRDSDGMVDLIIDENNPQNYFIDFEINRISGNLSTDYSTENSQPKNTFSE